MKKIFQKKWLILIVLIAAIIGYFFFSQPKKEEKTYEATKKNLKEELVFSGKIDAEEKAVLRFQTSGRLAWVGVKEGQTVKKYQAIASLDQRDLKNRLDKYLNTYAKQRNSFDQTIDDYQKTWTTAPDKLIADKAKRILENSQYDLNNAVLDVEYQNFTLIRQSLVAD
jgi:macrolide-specific efflux system membrane fusion protein